jgi:hypothetical protein
LNSDFHQSFYAAAGKAAAFMEGELRMRNVRKSTILRARYFLSIFFFSAIAVAAWPQAAPDFSGLWKQDNDRSQPKRSGDVTVSIRQSGPELTVETTISRSSKPARHAVQNYTTDGKVSVSTGADGDEFHTSVVWKDSSLVFSIEEHEEGRILRSREIWSLLDNGATLQRARESPDGEKQILIFRRQQEPSSN